MKASLRVQAFRQKLPDVSLSLEPVLTRWGTWLTAVDYYSEHFQELKELVATFEDNAVCVSEAKKIVDDCTVHNDLIHIKSHFTFIAT
ncbi:hypothetical protein ANN_03199 [Periplaneta americana]|uniref:Uncharacterized protein n=1 Tax=Periplaneta americana TaxID=6978 RepID=A0ABQ8U2A3_PERAM|nr:hypothetical protein ANN_03199 [Periplaneta americana]